jgi:hypothetical protein
MTDTIVLGGRYIARATAHNTQNGIQSGAEARVSFVDAADVSFEIVGKNGNLRRGSYVASREAFGANFTHDRTTPSNRGYVGSRHSATRFK